MSFDLDTIYKLDCLEGMKQIGGKTIDAIITDPPYFDVIATDYKGEHHDWDKQWKSRDEYLEWFGQIMEQFARIIKDNGSLYCFADNLMSWRIQQLIDKEFDIRNVIIWQKTNGMNSKYWRHIRAYASTTEHCIFAERRDIRNQTGLSQIMCNPDCFKEIRSWLCEERERLMHDKGMNDQEFSRFFAEITSTKRMDYHYFGSYEWMLPTEAIFNKMQSTGYWMVKDGRSVSYEELRQQYEELRQQYEELRRPFHPKTNFTDVWTSLVTATEEGGIIHPTQKPIFIIERMICTSTKPGALVLDPFMGSGTTAVACIRNGRRFLGFETNDQYYNKAMQRIEKEQKKEQCTTRLDDFFRSEMTV